MTNFVHNGNLIRVLPDDAIRIQRELEPGNYSVVVDRGELVLQKNVKMSIPHKIYGSTKNDAERIINTFKDRSTNTGVLLSGDKGSGKTLLAKLVASECEKLNIPTLSISSRLGGNVLATFLQNIGQECVIIFDEFEKVYSHNEEDQDGITPQESLLSLLDGIYDNKMLFILTCNSVHKIDSNLINRPGRIYYYKRFSGLESDFIEEYCKDELKDKEKLNEVLNRIALLGQISFDVLKAIIEECNRYPGNIKEAFSLLNIGNNDGVLYEMKCRLIGSEKWTHCGRIVDPTKLAVIHASPSNGRYDFSIGDYDKPDDKGKYKLHPQNFTLNHFKRVDKETKDIYYQNDEAELCLSIVLPQMRDHWEYDF